MPDNSQSRKWTMVINNPQECGMTHDVIAEILMRFCPEYFCMADEIASTGTVHTHIFLYSPSPIRFSTLKNRFPTAHIEKVYGSASQNRDYITKSGKWANDDKAETAVKGSFMEYGNVPSEKEERSPRMCRLISNIQDGMSTAEIVNTAPELAFRIREIDALRQTLMSEKYAKELREVDVTYIFGASGAGKTSGIYRQHDARDICRITSYRRGVIFDGYCGQDVLVFEEFNSQIPIETMLNYFDIYPLHLPARYNDKIACYPNIDEYNRGTQSRLRRIIFACDEVAEILDKTGLSKEKRELVNQIEGLLSAIARLGRAFGIHLILATQRPDATILSGQIRNNIDCRVCGRADNVLSQIILDSTIASDEIPKDAQGRFITRDGTVFQGYWMEERAIE